MKIQTFSFSESKFLWGGPGPAGGKKGLPSWAMDYPSILPPFWLYIFMMPA